MYLGEVFLVVLVSLQESRNECINPELQRIQHCSQSSSHFIKILGELRALEDQKTLEEKIVLYP